MPSATEHAGTSFDNRAFWNDRYRSDPALGSGFGSRGEIAERKAKLIGCVARAVNASSVIDVGSGDLEVVRRACLPPRYLGIDISDEVIKRNQRLYPEWSFRVADVGGEEDPELPTADLILCFDVLIHQHDVDAYRRFLRRLVMATDKIGLVAGYERPPETFTSAIVAFHEPLSQSLRAAGACQIEVVDEYRETTVLGFRRSPASERRNRGPNGTLAELLGRELPW